MALSISGSGGGIPADLAQIVYGEVYWDNNTSSTNPCVINCTRGLPKAILMLSVRLTSGDEFPYRQLFYNLADVGSSYVSKKCYPTQNNSMQRYFKFDADKLYMYGTNDSISSGTLYYSYFLIY